MDHGPIVNFFHFYSFSSLVNNIRDTLCYDAQSDRISSRGY